MTRHLPIPHTPSMADALKAAGYQIPDECVDISMSFPVEGAIDLTFRVHVTPDVIQKIGRALVAMGDTDHEPLRHQPMGVFGVEKKFPRTMWGLKMTPKPDWGIACETCGGSGEKPGTWMTPCVDCRGFGWGEPPREPLDRGAENWNPPQPQADGHADEPAVIGVNASLTGDGIKRYPPSPCKPGREHTWETIDRCTECGFLRASASPHLPSPSPVRDESKLSDYLIHVNRDAALGIARVYQCLSCWTTLAKITHIREIDLIEARDVYPCPVCGIRIPVKKVGS